MVVYLLRNWELTKIENIRETTVYFYVKLGDKELIFDNTPPYMCTTDSGRLFFNEKKALEAKELQDAVLSLRMYFSHSGDFRKLNLEKLNKIKEICQIYEANSCSKQ